jgi:putative phosphoribosyl transferase
MIFQNRADAGRVLAEKLQAYANRPDVLVLALPRGGVPVAYEVARKLNAPLDVFLVRKLGVPGQEELAMGAIASGGAQVMNADVVRNLNITDEEISDVARHEHRELERREQSYRGSRPVPEIRGRRVILVDDGLATGASMRAAVLALLQHEPREIVVAVPVAARETCMAFEDLVDEVVCAITPDPFYAVGMWYNDFGQTSDEEVRDLLERAHRLHPVNS